MTYMTDTAEATQILHVSWHIYDIFSCHSVCVTMAAHKHCDTRISMSSRFEAMNQSNIHAIKAEKGCDYYCTKYYVVRVPFLAHMFLLLLVTDECFMAPWHLAHGLGAVRGPSHFHKTAFKQTDIVIIPGKGLWCSTKPCGYLRAAFIKASLRSLGQERPSAPELTQPSLAALPVKTTLHVCFF